MKNIPDTIPNLPSPKFLNLEYIYAKIFTLLDKLPDLILWLLSFLLHRILKITMLAVALVFLLLIAILIYKFFSLKRRKDIKSSIVFANDDAVLKNRSNKWKDIKKKAESDVQDERKKAIIEADSILASIFDGMGFKADGLGEKLKSVEPSDFLSMQDAWEAHKTRVKVVDPTFELSKEDAKSVLEKYEKGLKELGYV